MTDLDNLNGAQIAVLVEAIQMSFDEAQLTMLLRTRLNRNLGDLAKAGTWPERVFNVVDESQKQGFGKHLIDAIERDRPEVARIKGLRQRLATLEQVADPVDSRRNGGGGVTVRMPPTVQTWLIGAVILLLAVIASVMVYDRTNPIELTIEEYTKLLDQARNEIKETNPDEEGIELEEGAKERVESEQGGSIAITTKFWPASTVPYELSPDLPAKSEVLAAITEYQDKTNIRFVERTPDNASRYPNYVTFKNGQGCSSYVGMTGGNQYATIGKDCTFGTVLHEIGHTLGMYHEQSRPDRDKYVKINWDNVIDGFERNFAIVETSVNQRRPYDYESIMHFPQTAFSRNGKHTIESLLPTVTFRSRDRLSSGDILLINAIYPKVPG